MSAFAFLRDVARRPTQMGAIAPSGSQLGEMMAREVGIEPDHVVVELGAGTGSLTQAIRNRAPHAPLLALEPGAEMAEGLRRRFPDIEVSQRLAHELPEVLREWGHPAVDRVVSGLPWTIWPDHVQNQILDAVVSCMKPDGQLVTFTYVHSQVLPGADVLKKMLDRYFGSVRKTPIAWLNLPPAFAYVASQPRKK